MINNYPLFENKKVKKEYTNKINNIFKDKGFNWTAYPAGSELCHNIFLGKNGDRMLFGFPNIYKIGIYTEDGVARLAIKGLLSMKTSPSKKVLEDKGYKYGISSERSNLCELIKPLDNLEAVVGELKDIEQILLQK